MQTLFSQFTYKNRHATIFKEGKLNVFQTPENDLVCIQNGSESSVLMSTAEWNNLARPELKAPTFSEWQKFWKK